MSINLADVFDTKRRRYGGQESEDFTDSFRLALLRTLQDIQSQKVGLDIDYDAEDLENSELDIDSTYLGVISDGIDYYLSIEGKWGMATKVDLSRQYEQSLNRAHTRYRTSITTYTRLGEV